jgi:hypothetical protein
LKGKLTFKKGGKKLVYKKLTAKVGKKGNLKGKAGKVFSLKGGKVSRDGFGAKISGVKVKFLKGAAKKVNKALDLGSLHQGKAGTASVSEQPETVEVTGGTASVTAAATAGSVLSKLQAHCINPLTGLTIVAPATHPNPVNPLLTDFPITGGTLSPLGTDGVVQQAGGVMFTKTITGPNGLGQTCPAGGQSLSQTDVASNQGLNQLQAHVVVAGTGTSFDGDKGIAIVADIDPATRTVAADPNAHTISVTGDVIKINALSATTLNQLFPQAPPTNPANDFAAGDVFGTSGLTATTR